RRAGRDGRHEHEATDPQRAEQDQNRGAKPLMSVVPVVRPNRRWFARAGGHFIWIAGAAAVLAGVTYKVGVLPALLALAGLLALPLLLNNSRAAFGTWITVIVVAENTADWHVSVFDKLYTKTP